MVLALIVLIGFGVLFMFAFDEGLQGEGHTIESVIASQAKDIAGFHQAIATGRETLALAPARIATSNELSAYKRTNAAQKEELAKLTAGVEGGKAMVQSQKLAFDDYKDEYRGFVRGNAKGTTLPELKTVAGIVYKNVNIREVTAVGMQIRHDDGQKRIPFEDLSEEMRDYYQFDPNQKDEALAAESSARKVHEDEVDAANVIADQQMGVQRAKEAQAARESAMRTLALKEASAKALEGEIKQLSDSLPMEMQKKLSRAGIIREQIADKQNQLSALRSQIASLRSHL